MTTIDTQIIDRGSFQGSEFDLTKWDRFVLRHTKPLNLWIHVLSMLMYFVAPLVALLTGNLWWLLGPVLSGSVGALGHWLSGDGGVSFQEATVEVTVPFYVPLVFWKILTGSYFTYDVPRARAKRRQKSFHCS